jgi:hypothetical protein
MKTQHKRNGLIRLTLVGVIGLAFLIATGAPAWADLEDVLMEKGTITKEDWLKIKADKEKAQAKQEKGMEYGSGSKDKSASVMKGVDIGVVLYFNATYARGDSFTGNSMEKGINNATANNNKGLANGFHFSRTYLNVRKYFEEGHHMRLTLDQMVNNVGGNSCPNAGPSAGNCHEASPFGLSGFSGGGRNATFVKYAYYDHKFSPWLHLRVGQNQTPWIEYEEHRWTYRYLFPIFTDQQNFQTSSDLGISLLGKVLDDRVDYHFSFQNGEGYQNTPDARSFALLGRVSVEPVKGIIISAFGHNEQARNGREGFNPQRWLGNVEFYDPTNDRFKVNAQMVWADDGDDVGKPGNAINVPGTYDTGVADTTAVTYGGTSGPSTGIPRFKNARGYEFWAWHRIPGIEKVRLHGRYYFMKPNEDTPAGGIQSYYFGISYDYSKYLAFSLDYTVLNETVLGSSTTVGAQTIATGGACATCGQFVKYDNQILGLRALITF